MSWHKVAAGYYHLGGLDVRRWADGWTVYDETGPLTVFDTFREAKRFCEGVLNVSR